MFTHIFTVFWSITFLRLLFDFPSCITFILFQMCPPCVPLVRVNWQYYLSIFICIKGLYFAHILETILLGSHCRLIIIFTHFLKIIVNCLPASTATFKKPLDCVEDFFQWSVFSNWLPLISASFSLVLCGFTMLCLSMISFYSPCLKTFDLTESDD